MATSAEKIVQLYLERKMACGPLHAAAVEVRDVYQGDLVVPLPELDRNEKRAVPNLLAQGLNQLAARISSTLPDVTYWPDRPGRQVAESYARIRRQANLGWWENSNMKLLLGRRSRHLLGYATSPVMIVPDFDAGVPSWELRHPLATYPAETTNPDDVDPTDSIHAYKRTLGWLDVMHPDAAARFARTSQDGPNTKIELLDYIDGTERVLVAYAGTAVVRNQGAPQVELLRADNRAGVCTSIVPGRITLDRRMGAYDGMVGLYQRQATLMALEVIAVKQGIFPDEWLIGRQGETPEVITMADGLRGVLGIARGGAFDTRSFNPGYKTDQTISALERAQRLEAGIPAEFGGESTTNVRTGRRGDSILSAVVDFPVQEAQHIFEVSLERENRVGVAVAKGYFGGQATSFYVSAKGARGLVDYTPNKHFTSDSNTVSYAQAGADVNSLTIGLGQMIGVGLISKTLGRELHPMIDDPEREHERTITESLEMALLSSLQQAAAVGQVNPADLASIMDQVATGASTLVQAVQQVQQAAQTRQATAGPVGTPEGPVPPGAPAAQPGLGPQGNSNQAGVAGPADIAPSPNESGLASLMAALRGGAAA